MKEEHIPLLGAHMSVAGGVWKAIDRALRVDSTALQIFVKNASRWQGPVLDDGTAQRFQKSKKSSPIRLAVAHNSYLINLASPSTELWKKSIEALLDEMDRSYRLGLDFLVLHPGSHTGSGEQAGLSRVAEALNQVQEQAGTRYVPLALETTAGQGSSLGYRFQHFRDILAQLESPQDVFLCLDTCHVFAAGHDLRTREGYEHMIEQCDQTVGLSKLKVIHVNDSKRELGSRKDRHEHIGKGEIGLKAFERIMNDPRLQDISKILETPKGDDDEWDEINLKVLRGLIR